MSVPEPRNLPKHARPLSNNPYEGRWRWWYSAIADFRLAHPGCKIQEIADSIGKSPTTIGFIVNTDMYREYEAQRRAHFQMEAEAVLRSKLLRVADRALDALDLQLERKQDQVPLAMAKEIAQTTLDRLGFAPKTAQAPAVVVNNNVNSSQVVLPGSVSATALEEARMALRAAERQRLAPLAPPATVCDIELEAEPLDANTGSRLEESEGELDGPSAVDS